MKKKKSSIRSARLRKLVDRTVDKALEECATQHDLHAESYSSHTGEVIQPTPEMLAFAKTQPVKLKITFEFTWPDDTEEKLSGKSMFCTPVIDLGK